MPLRGSTYLISPAFQLRLHFHLWLHFRTFSVRYSPRDLFFSSSERDGRCPPLIFESDSPWIRNAHFQLGIKFVSTHPERDCIASNISCSKDFPVVIVSWDDTENQDGYAGQHLLCAPHLRELECVSCWIDGVQDIRGLRKAPSIRREQGLTERLAVEGVTMDVCDSQDMLNTLVDEVGLEVTGLWR